MYDSSRKKIYDWLYDLFYDVVTKNVYAMFKPLELTSSDTKNGFLVIRIGDFIDASEFQRNAFGECRVFVTAYVPLLSRGRLDYTKYDTYEQAIDNVIQGVIDTGIGYYTIIEDSILSMDDIDDENATNQFATYTKSFVVTMDGDNQIANNSN